MVNLFLPKALVVVQLVTSFDGASDQNAISDKESEADTPCERSFGSKDLDGLSAISLAL